MPLPSDQKIVELSERILKQFDAIFGLHPGFRPAHAKGLLLTGEFMPTPAAGQLSSAPHFHRPSTPVTARFSNSSGFPLIPDNDPNADPRGLGLRFHLGERVHTDIVAHSANGFPVRTGDEFLEFLNAIAASAQNPASPSPVEQFIGSHPTALAFVQIPKPMPVSFATENYFGLTAMCFISAEGHRSFIRYRIVPEAGAQHLTAEEAKSKDPNSLFTEVKERVNAGTVRLRVLAQVANPEDTVDNVTVSWPEDRRIVELGTVTLTAVAPDNTAEQQHIIFDPIPRVEGIEPSADPLLELRAAVYLLSGRRRRSAEPAATASAGH